MKLYTYFRSSAAYRVRIALRLKGIDAEMLPIHLVKNGGMQLQADYRAINPEGLVPTLTDEGQNLSQSLSIIEYLDETHPTPALLPNNALDGGAGGNVPSTVVDFTSGEPVVTRQGLGEFVY